MNYSFSHFYFWHHHSSRVIKWNLGVIFHSFFSIVSFPPPPIPLNCFKVIYILLNIHHLLSIPNSVTDSCPHCPWLHFWKRILIDLTSCISKFPSVLLVFWTFPKLWSKCDTSDFENLQYLLKCKTSHNAFPSSFLRVHISPMYQANWTVSGTYSDFLCVFASAVHSTWKIHLS